MTSDGRATSAFVWVWLPGSTDPVVAGRVDVSDGVTTFGYGQGYLDRPDAIALFLPELPLRRGAQRRTSGALALCVADAAPDGWGQRVIENRRVADGATTAHDFDILDYLLASSGDDRIGALDVGPSTQRLHEVIEAEPATVEELAQSAAKVEAGETLSPQLDRALLHGTSIGGARPKALLRDGDRALIAKFGSPSDPYPVVKGEFLTMELARRVGLDVAGVELTNALGKDVLMVERFDRPGDGSRRIVVSAKTMLDLDEYEAWYATYWELADIVRSRFTAPGRTLRELFSRISFNILVGNTDDHARNHAAFWDGEMLTLTPAYDICPQLRAGGEAAQAMAIASDGFRSSQVAGCVERAGTYLLSDIEAREIVDHQIHVIESEWQEVADLASLSEVDRAAFWHRQILNPYSLEGY